MNLPASRYSSERGSIAIIALLFAGIFAISLVSFIRLGNQSLKLADRSFKSLAAMNLADLGLEEAVYAFNQIDDTSLATAFGSWTTSGNDATRAFTNLGIPQATASYVKVYIKDYNASGSTMPVAVAKAVVTPPHGRPIERWVEAKLRQRTLFSHGLVAKNNIILKSDVFVDSFVSDTDGNPATPGVLFSSGGRRDKGFLGSVSGSIDISNSNVAIYGKVATGGGNISTGGDTSVYDASDGASSHPPSPRIYNSSLVTKDFSSTFPAIILPTPAITNLITSDYFVDVNRTLPRTGDLADSDGRYYYTFGSGRVISLTSNYTLTINDKVTFIMNNHAGMNAIELTSNDKIALGTSGNVEVYTNGDIFIDSNTRINGDRTPDRFSIYGTKTGTSQTFEFNSNALCNLVIYAPNADAILGSNAELSGSFIAGTIDCDSNVRFHFDESLNNATAGNPFSIVEWKELTDASERAAYASAMSF